MTLLANLKIKYKLFLMLFFPVVGLLYFAPSTVLEKYQVAREMAVLEKITNFSVEIAELLHQMQLERDLSGAFAEHRGNQYADELKQQRLKTDEVIESLLENFKVEDFTVTLKTDWHKVIEMLHSIKAKRLLFNPALVSKTEAIETYSTIITDLIQLIQGIATLSNHNEILTLELNYILFLSSKELAGLERSILFSAFTQKRFAPGQFQQLVEVIAQQRLYRRSIFKWLATPEQQALLEQKFAASPFQETQRIREQIYAAGSEGTLADVDPSIWFQMQTQKINLLKDVENKLAQDLSAKADEIENRAYAEFQFALLIVSVLLSLAALLVYLLLKALTRPLQQAVAIADAITLGNLDNQIEANSNDETGRLLQSLAIMQGHLKKRLEEDKRIANEALRLNRALDSVTTYILMTDNQYHIIYLNEAAQRFFIAVEEIIRQELPHFEARRLLGASIDAFHKNPSHQHHILNSLTETHRTTLRIAGLFIDTHITPVINANGERLGAVVELTNRTLEVATEQEINAVIHAASQGNFQQRISLEKKTGFFQIFTERVNQIMELNEEMIKEIMLIFSALAQGDLTRTIDHNYTGDFEQLKQDANATVKKLTEVIMVIKQSAEVVNAAAEELSQGNASLSQRTEEQATSLEEIASSMEQMISTIQQNADNAKQATQLALGARNRAEQGGKVVGATVQAINEISHSSKKIKDIIGMINEIAFQTNLLALNAAVEAARAGEQGRGFAVVAAEVRNLAQRSAKAAKEIKELVQESVSKVAEGTKLANKSGETLVEIVTATKQVSDLIAQIATASQEQSVSIQYVNNALISMDSMTQQNSTLVEQAATASKSLSEQAQMLKQQVAFFQLGEDTVPVN
jgi:methyl-accepting chemotaxis protein